MSTDKIIVLIGSLIGVIGTYWFFLMKKDQVISVNESVDITVEGGYKPNSGGGCFCDWCRRTDQF
jgi:plastocyanin domain-containing protein